MPTRWIRHDTGPAEVFALFERETPKALQVEVDDATAARWAHVLQAYAQVQRELRALKVREAVVVLELDPTMLFT